MSGLEILESVQYVTVKGRRMAVLSADDWEAFVEWLETQEDLQMAKQAYATLKAAKNNRSQAGWHKWDEVKSELA